MTKQAYTQKDLELGHLVPGAVTADALDDTTVERPRADRAREAPSAVMALAFRGLPDVDAPAEPTEPIVSTGAQAGILPRTSSTLHDAPVLRSPHVKSPNDNMPPKKLPGQS